jgi:O-methyltransferase involved in polyketide biosynthesis
LKTNTRCSPTPSRRCLLDAAGARGWSSQQFDKDVVARLPEVDPQLLRWVLAQSAYSASRTKWFDEFLIAAGRANVRQAVILAAGLEVGVRSLG